MKRRDLIKLLKDAGYRQVRVGSHAIFERPGSRPVQVPNHRELNEQTAKQILKVAGIDKD